MPKYFVTPDDMKNIDQYLCALVTGIISIRNLHSYQAEAMKKGLLTDEQMEYAASMAFELQKLLRLYQAQISLVEELTKLDQKKVLKEYAKIINGETQNADKKPRDAKDRSLDAKKPRAAKKRDIKSPGK